MKVKDTYRYSSIQKSHVFNFKFQFSTVAQSCLTLCDPMDFHEKMGTIKDRNGIEKQNILRGGGKNTQKNHTKKIFMTQITTMV